MQFKTSYYVYSRQQIWYHTWTDAETSTGGIGNTNLSIALVDSHDASNKVSIAKIN